MNLEALKLEQGSHDTREDGMCAMEAVAWLAGEEHSDAPLCACSVLTSFVIRLNDRWHEADRQLLKPYLPRLLNTRDGKSFARAKVLAYKAAAVFAPIAAEIAGRKDLADEMRGIPFGDWNKQQEVCGKVQEAFSAESAAEYAAKYAARYAESAAKYAAEYAAKYAAESAESAAEYAAWHKQIIQECLAALEAAIEVRV